MSLPVRKFAPEVAVEGRLARLEAHVEHIQSDVTEIKSDVRQLRDSQIVLERHVRDGFESLRVVRLKERLWALGAMATLLGVMARGFDWI